MERYKGYDQKLETEKLAGCLIGAVLALLAACAVAPSGWGLVIFCGGGFLIFLAQCLAWSITGDIQTLIHYLRSTQGDSHE